MLHYDILVIGSGLAGLSFALKTAQYDSEISIAIISKDSLTESNTRYAQGGIAVVWDESKDSFDKHIRDTLIAGDGLCDHQVVEKVVTEGPARLRELINWGSQFDRSEEGEYNLGLEGGHSERRILHHKDLTGKELQDTLLKQVKRTPNITVFDHHMAIDLITQHHIKDDLYWREQPVTCFGAYVLDREKQQVITFSSKLTLLATGGIGQIYRSTTNPEVATGDGIAMAYRATARIQHMEFVQFHPTALYEASQPQAFLISEAVRGFGGILKNRKGKAFMAEYDDRKELAPRDIVARAIDQEMKKNGDPYVLLDVSHLDLVDFKNKFPTISDKCASIGIDVQHEGIPVVPSAHYLCGGIKVNLHGQTTVNNLLAVGESAATGLHGANRLASNSLLEAVVFAHRAFLYSTEKLSDISSPQNIPDWDTKSTDEPDELILITYNKQELKSIMSDYQGIIRSNERLKRVNQRLKILYEETETLYKKTVISPQLCELRNLITVSYLNAQQSMQRTENRGVFFNSDLV
jgi:L-aspartate oxidase